MSETLQNPYQTFAGSGPSFFTLYAKSTGEIIGSLTHSGNATCVTDTIGETPGTYDGSTFFYSAESETCILRPAMLLDMTSTNIKADGKTNFVAKGVPNGAIITIDGGAPQTCTDGELDFTATNMGSYDIVISSFPYLDINITVIAS